MDSLLYFMGQSLLFGSMYLLGRYSVKAQGYAAGYIDGLKKARDILQADTDKYASTSEQSE